MCVNGTDLGEVGAQIEMQNIFWKNISLHIEPSAHLSVTVVLMAEKQPEIYGINHTEYFQSNSPQTLQSIPAVVIQSLEKKCTAHVSLKASGS